MPRGKRSSESRGVSAVLAGIVVALVLFSAFGMIVFLRHLQLGRVQEDIERQRQIQEKLRESLTAQLIAATGENVVFSVYNSGDIAVSVTGLERRLGDRLETTPFSTELAPNEQQTFTIQSAAFDGLGLLTSRGNLFGMPGSSLGGIEILVLDSETGEPIENASVDGTIHSYFIPVSLRTDNQGLAVMYFNIGDTSHSFDLLADAIAYDENRVAGTITKTDNRQILIELNYHPFDVELSENSGGLTRGYSSYSYSGRYSVPFTAQRTVPVLDSNGNQVYDTVTSTRLVGYTWEQKVTRTRVEEYVSGYKYSYTEYRRNWNWLPPGWGSWYYYSSGTETFGDYKGSSFTRGGSWYEGWKREYSFSKKVYSTRRVSYETWETRSSSTHPGWGDDVRNVRKVYETTTTQVPRTRIETYTAYHNYEYGGTGYLPNPWGTKQVEVRAVPRNGYTGGVKLEVVAPEGIHATLGSSSLTFASPASTTMSLTPSHALERQVKVKASDSYGRLVKTRGYGLTAIDSPPSGSSWTRLVGTSTMPDEVPPTITGTETETVPVPAPLTIDAVYYGNWDDRRSDVPVDTPMGQWLMANVYSWQPWSPYFTGGPTTLLEFKPPVEYQGQPIIPS